MSMQINRRSFLGGALTVAAVAFAPAIMADVGLPHIVGDGVHDDTAGLQAALDGEPFICNGQVICGANSVRLNSGIYRLTKTLMLDRQVDFGGGPEASPAVLGYVLRDEVYMATHPVLLVDHAGEGLRVRNTESAIEIRNLEFRRRHPSKAAILSVDTVKWMEDEARWVQVEA